MKRFIAPYKVTVFGGLQVQCPSGSIVRLQTCRTRALFVLLLIHRCRMIHREYICNKLWPDLDEPNAKSQLRKTLWRLRSALLPSNQQNDNPIIRIAEYHVGLDHMQINADCWQFADAMKSVEFKKDAELTSKDAQILIDAINMNCDNFATGIFDEWCLTEREHLLQARLEAHERLVGYHRKQGHWQQAIHWAQQALALDPIREHLYHAVMSCQYSIGDRASAIRQYKICAELLQNELGIRPSQELHSLYKRIIGTEHLRLSPQ